mgnify:CR=1 FL=1
MWVVLYTILFLIGSVLAYFSFVQYQKTKNLLVTGVKTTATVIELVESSGDGGPSFSPVFEFTDKTQIKRTFKSGISSRPAAYELGEKVKIIYDGKDKDDVRTISFWGLYRASVILFMIAAPFIIIGGSYLLYVYG